MKPMSLLVACGIVISLAVATNAQADQRNKQHAQREQQDEWRPPNASAERQTVPRGDLRGDIASNARARIGLRTTDPPRHP